LEQAARTWSRWLCPWKTCCRPVLPSSFR
jgi:hypothetical protein